MAGLSAPTSLLLTCRDANIIYWGGVRTGSDLLDGCEGFATSPFDPGQGLNLFRIMVKTFCSSRAARAQATKCSKEQKSAEKTVQV